MCLILFSYKSHPDYKLIMAANRDGYYDRPVRKAYWHKNQPDILAGQDMRAGGTWMGINRLGRFAALTNYRDPADMREGRSSRGLLVYNFLKSNISPANYISLFNETTERYNSYNLILGDIDSLYYYSNKTENALMLDSGIYGLSNHLLDTGWEKVRKGKERLKDTISYKFTTEDLFEILRDKEKAPDELLPETGVSLEYERLLSPMFIESEKYGTRSSTVMLIDHDDNVTYTERTYHKNIEYDDASFKFRVS